MMKKWNDTDSSCSSVESDIMIVAFYYIRQQSNTITKRQRTFNHTETELIKLNQFTSKNDVIEYLLDTIYALEHPPMTP